ncbi:MAG: thioredoxin domain-containing protein [Rhodothermales bacterium]|nr:thioredoxin domain-containing protein [Rhodothermales bacterium]
MPNRLANAQSPYLLQHQDNPVDWYEWGEAAFEAARREDKPIFLSIGYSTCHWCHVMAHESFEDDGVAALMNRAFVNVKVDREERPDLDQLYMTVCQMMTGSGGWPLTLLLTPEKKPFFATTYIPRETRGGRLGMLEWIPRVEAAWAEHRADVVASADEVTGLLQQAAALDGSDAALDHDAPHLAFAQLQRRYDAQHGGFGGAPKFPSPHTLVFLLRYGHRTGEAAATHMAAHTLRRMRLGGIFDHVGYGFHRYATDATWTLPHFEKMLYDQAMLAWAYTEAFQATREPVFEATAREVLAYVLRDLAAPEGGFFSAEDADSEGREGAFYVWTLDELGEALGPDLAPLAARLFEVEAAGNFEDEATRRRTGENVLHLRKPLTEWSEVLEREEAALRQQVEVIRERLYEHRAQRPRPGLDDKILTDWNGLMLGALARAARVFEDDGYRAAALRTAGFVLSTMRTDDGRLLHRYRDGHAGLDANLDDYAFLIHGLDELYATSFEPHYLRTAVELMETALARFWDAERGAFFFAPADRDDLIVRPKEAYDGALPSGNSMMMLNLLRLGRLTGRPAWEQRAEDVGRFFGEAVRRQPSGFTGMLLAQGFAVGPAYEVVLAGDPREAGMQAMVEALRGAYVPESVVVLRPPGDAPALAELAPYTADQRALGGQATAYVCRRYACEAPTTDPAAMLSALGIAKS